MIKGENSRKDLERSLPTVYICSRYRPKSADPERQKIELKGGFYEVSDECRMVEGSRYPCCKDDVPDRRSSDRDPDARWYCGLMAVGSAAIVAGVASLGTSLAGLPELEKEDKA